MRRANPITIMSVNAKLIATGVDLPAGQSDFWQTGGLTYGMGVWYEAWPIEHLRLEVTHVTFEVDAARKYLVNTEVHNNSTDENSFCSYGLFVLHTEVIP